ncbi:hypothetical protein PR048_033408 [Dryococelus australis]|uniref:Uncharacterized protein n=1 Tax=Dryococelus australis TaxID=614101 RepID=A0ABQ9G074_9NEOP|nr:hypothetical protein PR048_033408 [Dryococelus australis]
MRVNEVNMERRRNEGEGETGDPRRNPPTNGIVRHDSHLRKSATRPRIEPAKSSEPMRAIEVSMEQRQNERLGKRDIPEKTRQPTAASGTIPTCGNPVTRQGFELGSPWWEASRLTARPRLISDSEWYEEDGKGGGEDCEGVGRGDAGRGRRGSGLRNRYFHFNMDAEYADAPSTGYYSVEQGMAGAGGGGVGEEGEGNQHQTN